MPEDMGLQAQLINSLKQINASDVTTADESSVTRTVRRSVGDEHISIIRNQRPRIAQGLAPIEHEGPVHESRQIGRAHV